MWCHCIHACLELKGAYAKKQSQLCVNINDWFKGNYVRRFEAKTGKWNAVIFR